MRIEVILGIILIADGILCSIFASPLRVTYNLLNLSSSTIFYIGYIFRAIRIVIGVILVFNLFKIEKYFLFLGFYLVLDAIFSFVTSSNFEFFDDYFRISRFLIGGYLIGKKIW